jgi:glycerophosphoryl diester phosphodiesterase
MNKAWMLILLLSCFSAKKNQTKISSFDKHGHRGCRGLMPENTIPAMLKAIDLGVTTLETDVVITADQQVILSHEPFFSHDITTKPDGSYVTAEEEKKLNIFQMDYATVRKYDVGSKPFSRFPKQQKIATYKPLLSDMIDSVLAYCTKMGKPVPAFNIETKSQPATDGIYHPAPALFVDLIMEVIHRKQIQEKTTIQSFDIRTLQYLHQKYPSIPTALLIEGNHPQTFALQLKELGFVPTIYSPYFSLVTPLLVKQCRDLGVKLIPWTVNDRTKIQELRTLGVDGIITDFPDLF